MDDKLGLVLFGVAIGFAVLSGLDALIRQRQKGSTPKVMHVRRLLFVAGVVLTCTAGGVYGSKPTLLPHHLLLVIATVLATLTVLAFCFALGKDRVKADGQATSRTRTSSAGQR